MTRRKSAAAPSPPAPALGAASLKEGWRAALAAVEEWFAAQGWTPFPFQREVWDAYHSGESGLLHAPTGVGKSYAVWLAPLLEWTAAQGGPEAARLHPAPRLKVLWLTPLRALAGDTAGALRAAVVGLGLPWTVELRTGDTSSAAKQRQRSAPPSALVTTPESLSLLLSYPDSRALFAGLELVVVDEWHELMASKRGVMAELGLARLRGWNPGLRTWGLSATLANLEQAARALVGVAEQAPRLVTGAMEKTLRVDTLIPAQIERFPWAGHLGMKLLPEVARAVGAATSTLIFTNTRAQTELWFQALIDAHPELAGAIALHHGSLEPELRRQIEERLRDGLLRCVVATSSLDLGVDFAPVDQVIQVGSPKGVARLMQRAGRSGHRPGAASRILCVPTHAFELIEFAAAREAVARGEIEARAPLEKPLDVLVQHLVTVALGGGFTAAEMLAEARTTWAYRELSEQEWLWCLGFVTHGGSALRAYPQYSKVVEEDGRYTVPSRQIATFHRMSIGTITSDSMLKVRFAKGGSLGSVEEGFIARLRPGDRFIFAGRVLELIQVRDMTAYVRKARGGQGVVPRWMGGRMPLSSQLAGAVRRTLAAARRGEYATAELGAVRPLLELQARWSRIPAPGELLVERVKTRDGYHIFLFPLAGRLAHEGLAVLLAYRLTQDAPRSISAFVTDYGVELLCADPFPDTLNWPRLLSPEHLLDDVLATLNTSELARRQFRDIARIAGLVFSGYPGSQKTARQLQVSSGLLYDVFRDYDPDNLLLAQARREVLEQQLDIARLRATLATLQAGEIVEVAAKRLTPLAFPIWAERFRTQVSSEEWSHRVQRMVLQLENAAR